MANRIISSDGEGAFDGIPGHQMASGAKKAFVVDDLDLVIGVAQRKCMGAIPEGMLIGAGTVSEGTASF